MNRKPMQKPLLTRSQIYNRKHKKPNSTNSLKMTHDTSIFPRVPADGWVITLISFLGRPCSKHPASYDCGRSLVIPRQLRPYLNTDLVVKLLTHYIGLYDLNRNWSCFNNLFENSLDVQYTHDDLFFMRMQNMKKYFGVSMIADWSRLTKHRV